MRRDSGTGRFRAWARQWGVIVFCASMAAVFAGVALLGW